MKLSHLAGCVLLGITAWAVILGFGIDLLAGVWS